MCAGAEGGLSFCFLLFAFCLFAFCLFEAGGGGLGMRRFFDFLIFFLFFFSSEGLDFGGGVFWTSLRADTYMFRGFVCVRDVIE